MSRRALAVLGRLRRQARDEASVALAELRQAIASRDQALAQLTAKRAAEAGGCPPELLGDWSRWSAATRRLEHAVRDELEALRRLEQQQEAALLRSAADHRALELVLEAAARDERFEARRRVQTRLDETATRRAAAGGRGERG
jgi:flagellar biosynthesis chaperone FliJ